MSGLEPLAQTHGIKHYSLGKMQKSQLLPPNGRLQKRPPVVIPEELPATTMRRILVQNDLAYSDDYKSIVAYLTTYQRQGENRAWETFRNKIPPPLLKTWGDIVSECRRNGFIAPRAEGEIIVFRQVVSTGSTRNGDLCTMCERECAIRENVDSGEAKRRKHANQDYKEEPPCWDSEGA